MKRLYLSAELTLGSSENPGRIASVPTLIKFTSHFYVIEICLFRMKLQPSLTAQTEHEGLEMFLAVHNLKGHELCSVFMLNVLPLPFSSVTG